MRTTLTLDEDIAAKLQALVRESGRTFRDVVNDTLRLGLAYPRKPVGREPFTVNARDLGCLRPGLSLDNIGVLLEQVEGVAHR